MDTIDGKDRDYINHTDSECRDRVFLIVEESNQGNAVEEMQLKARYGNARRILPRHMAHMAHGK